MFMRFVFIAGCCLLSLAVFAQEEPDAVIAVDSASSLNTIPDTVTVIGVGDIMMGTSYPEDRLPPNDGKFLLSGIAPVLRDADVTFGNLEGTLLDEGGTPKTCKDPKVCYAFRSPTRYVNNLVDAGFDMMSLANNHAGDMGDEGRDTTMNTLLEAGILHAGQMSMKTAIFIKDSVRYGLAAFAPNANCVP